MQLTPKKLNGQPETDVLITITPIEDAPNGDKRYKLDKTFCGYTHTSTLNFDIWTKTFSWVLSDGTQNVLDLAICREYAIDQLEFFNAELQQAVYEVYIARRIKELSKQQQHDINRLRAAYSRNQEIIDIVTGKTYCL